MDIQMEAGVDFSEQINEAVGSCGALIVLIGEDWVTVADADGKRRIDDPADIHRMEVEAGLDRRVRLIPALVQDARMPRAEDLPEELRPLTQRQAHELSDERWDYDIGRLTAVLDRVLAGEPRSGLRRITDRLGTRLRRISGRHPLKAGFAAGALAALVAVGILLAATGYFASPQLEVTSFQYEPPPAGDSFAERCRVQVASLYRVTSARFFIDGDRRNFLDEQNASPWDCANDNANGWDTCHGHSPGFPLEPGRHEITAVITDADGNTHREHPHGRHRLPARLRLSLKGSSGAAEMRSDVAATRRDARGCPCAALRRARAHPDRPRRRALLLTLEPELAVHLWPAAIGFAVIGLTGLVEWYVHDERWLARRGGALLRGGGLHGRAERRPRERGQRALAGGRRGGRARPRRARGPRGPRGGRGGAALAARDRERALAGDPRLRGRRDRALPRHRADLA